jgi:hypothetical protein
MKVSTFQVSGFRFWAAVLVCVLLIATLLPLVVQAAPPALLPPLPPMPPTSGRRSRPEGCFIELHVQFPPAWPWAKVHWQELWTTVQWQDARREWHAVEGWQGTLDGVRFGDGEAPIGEKTWWAAEDDLGAGPFRWAVYRATGGRLLAASEPFYLPGSTGATATVDVSLGAP